MIEIEVHGVKEFVSGLGELRSLTEHVEMDSETFAAKATVDMARPNVPVLSGAAAATLRVMDYSDGAAATGGSSAVEYYGWLEFGGDAGRNHSVHRSVVPQGRYLHPAYLAVNDRIERKMEELLEDAVQDAGLS